VKQNPKRKPLPNIKKTEKKLRQIRRVGDPTLESYEILKIIEGLLSPFSMTETDPVDYVHIKQFTTAAKHYITGARQEYEQLLFGRKTQSRLLSELK
jgi:hypothetical protein